MADQGISSLDTVLRMMDDEDCRTLKRMLAYSLEIAPQYEARELLMELVAVLKGRLAMDKLMYSEGRMRKHVREVLEKAPNVSELLVI